MEKLKSIIAQTILALVCAGLFYVLVLSMLSQDEPGHWEQNPDKTDAIHYVWVDGE